MTSTWPPPPGPHPTPEELYRARHEAPSPETEAWLAHAALCAECSAELLRQEAFDHPEPLPAAQLDAAWERFTGRSPRAAVRPWRRWSRSGLALAATLTAVFVGWLAYRAQQPIATSVGDGVRSGTTVPSAEAWAPVGTIDGPPRELRFPNAGRAALRVALFDAARSYAWTSEETRDDHVALPPAEQGRLQPGVEYYWTLLGAAAGDSAAQSFVIAPQ